MRWVDAVRARLRLLFDRHGAESRMDEEIDFHIEMETKRLVREGVEPREARRRALVAFGGVERTKEELRSGRGLAWISGLRLDVKLGVRMLLKHPVLTGASVLALAIAVTLAASWFEFMTNLARPSIPLPDGERIVQLRNHDLATTDTDYSTEPRSLHDFELWREELEAVRDLAAASAIEHGVTTDDGRFTVAEGMRVTPSLFRVAGVEPLFGRTLEEADDRPGAEPVVVLGYPAWQRLFDGDRSAVGRTVRLGAEHATVVGVMPEGFGFPVNEEIWMPLRERAVEHGRREGPRVMIVGRLAPGRSLEEAAAELDVIGRRTAAAFPDTHEHLRPEIVRFGRGNDMSAVATALNIPFLLFLLVVSANVATLLFARTASRRSELALRSALGASRRRILLQLVSEAMVLTSLAAILGLSVAHWGLGWGMDLFWEVQQMQPPFWFSTGLSASTALYGFALAVVGALVIGGLPGLRATGRRLRERLPQPGAAGAGMRFGVVATGVIVAQVAICVAFIPVAIRNAQESLQGAQRTDFPADAYLTARLVRPLDARGTGVEAGPADGERPVPTFDEVWDRLESEPGVVAASRASRIPGFNHPVEALRIDGDTVWIFEVRSMAVDPDFFEVVEGRVVAGRPLRPEDAGAEAGVVVVSREWSESVLGDGSPVGRRIRYPGRDGEEAERWYEIVGVIDGVERAIGPGSQVSLFHPLKAEEHASVYAYLRTDGPPETFAPRVQAAVTGLDPRLGITDVLPLDEVWRPVERSDAFFTFALGVVAAVILLFALMGIYALMSFTVAQRAREIGIRAALGADPRRIVTSIFSRAMTQIGLGVVLGAVVVGYTVLDDPAGVRLVAAVAASMVVVGLAGCVLPARRALRIHPTEALRAE